MEVSLWAVALVCGTAVAGTTFERYRFERHFEKSFSDRSVGGIAADPGGRAALAREQSPFVARLEIPSVRLDALVVDGIDAATLRRSVGRIPSSSLPGEPGDVALAGHRDSDFRPLEHLRRGELVRLRTPEGPYEYRVESIRVVKPSQVEVLRPDDHATLTLVTCFPFRYVGAAPLRYVVRAREIARPFGRPIS